MPVDRWLIRLGPWLLVRGHKNDHSKTTFVSKQFVSGEASRDVCSVPGRVAAAKGGSDADERQIRRGLDNRLRSCYTLRVMGKAKARQITQVGAKAGSALLQMTDRPAQLSRDLVVSREEWRQMMQAGDATDRLILTLAVLGLRASEIARCHGSWFDWQRKTLRIPASVAKAGHGRIISIGFSPVYAILNASYTLRDGLNMTRQSIWRRVKKCAVLAGIRRRVTVHGLRATGATWAAEAGYSIEAIREIFGWAELRTAERYIAQSGRAAVAEVERVGGYI